MKRWLLIVAAGCATQPPSAQTPTCQTDADCAGDVCARDGACTAPADLQKVHVTWTIFGGPADATSCAAFPDFEVELFTDSAFPTGAGDELSFTPVPCAEGLFTVDRIPRRYWIAGAKTSATGDSSGMYVPLDATGTAAINLPY
jgi:hypothetical protein